MSTLSRYHVAIIGSGIAGSSLAAILARHGRDVVIFEAKSHPRFSIGESLILETSESMRALAELYDVPELATFSSENFLVQSGTSHGIKRHFGFLHHTAGQPQDPRHALQAIIPKEPHGHELHLYRQDTDYFLASTAVAYGATLLQNTPVTAVELPGDRVVIHTTRGDTYTADYVVDAGGFRSLLADKFDLRDVNLRTHARTIFTHMVGVPNYHRVGGSQMRYGLPYSMSEGTLHHIFDGGWLWVIPFNNHRASTNPLCSVGLLLDPRRYPQRDDLTAEAEFRSFIARFPSMAAQFADAHAVRDWVRTGRIQYSAKQAVGDRWALLGHAYGFIDPLYSKGLYTSFASVGLLAHLLLQAAGTGDYSAAAFAPLDRLSSAFIQSADRLVANSYKSFSNHRLWQVYSVMWLLGAYTELVRLNMMRARAAGDRAQYMSELAGLKLVGGGFPEFDQIATRIDAIFDAVEPHDERSVDTAVAQANTIFRSIDWIPDPFIALLDGKTYLPKNKLRLSLLKPEEGFMGRGAYRAHFFGDMTLRDLMRYGVREKVRYAKPVLAFRHRQAFSSQLK